MSKLLLKNSPIKPLPPFIRQRFTLQSALLTNPRKYIKNVRFDEEKKEKEIPERESPPKPLVSSKTQTHDVLDAETNTKSGLSSLETKKSKLKTKCSYWAKEARMASRSPYMEIARRMKREGSVSKKTTLPGAADSKKDLPGVKRRRGILKKVLEEVQIEGMCSQGTATEGNKPTLERILKENHIFLKYSRSCKPKKKRVRMEKQPAFSYFTKRPEESVLSLDASEEERPKKVTMHDEDSANSSEESLERKPARLALRSPSGHPDRDPDGDPDCDPDGATDSRLSVRVCNRASAPQLNASEKQLHLPRPRQIAQREDCEDMAEDADDSPKRPPCRVPRDRLYFKNMNQVSLCPLH